MLTLAEQTLLSRPKPLAISSKFEQKKISSRIPPLTLMIVKSSEFSQLKSLSPQPLAHVKA